MLSRSKEKACKGGRYESRIGSFVFGQSRSRSRIAASLMRQGGKVSIDGIQSLLRIQVKPTGKKTETTPSSPGRQAGVNGK